MGGSVSMAMGASSSVKDCVQGKQRVGRWVHIKAGGDAVSSNLDRAQC